MVRQPPAASVLGHTVCSIILALNPVIPKPEPCLTEPKTVSKAGLTTQRSTESACRETERERERQTEREREREMDDDDDDEGGDDMMLMIA